MGSKSKVRGQQGKRNRSRNAENNYAGSREDQHINKKPRNENTPRLDSEGNPIRREIRLPKRKVAIMVGYRGTGYHGMQYNPPHPTIEAELFDAFVKAGAISKENSYDPRKSGFMRSARTDKGVHAAANLISMKLIIEDPDIVKKINEALPETVRVWNIERINRSFDARKMCGSRWYEYLLPTYTLIGPKPNSILYKNIEESKLEFPNILDDDIESKEFWDTLEQEFQKHFTVEELQEIRSFKPSGKDGFNDSQEQDVYFKVKEYKQIEMDHRRKYRVSEEKISKFRSIMQQYLGAHNFHNFTVGTNFSDSSAIRYMKDISVSEPFVVGEANTEWVSIKIHGQSFMLHQIRKMISMATLMTRCGCPVERIQAAYSSQKLNIPNAPALGLLLDAPVFESFNSKLEKLNHKPIDFSKYNTEMNAFKSKHIYDEIYREEVNANVFNAFFGYIDNFNMVTGSKGVETNTKTGKAVQKSIFEFLTARGIPEMEDYSAKIAAKSSKDNITKEVEVLTPAEKLEQKSSTFNKFCIIM